MRYGMLRGAGLRVTASTEVAQAGSGEEMFGVRYDPAEDSVCSEVVAFSRPATWWSRLGAPALWVVQHLVSRRHLTAV